MDTLDFSLITNKQTFRFAEHFAKFLLQVTTVNLLAPELFFFILAHPVYKM